jgi:hypothetical protein
MVTLRIRVHHFKPLIDAGETRDNTILFDKTLDDEETVRAIYRKFASLGYGGSGHGGTVPGYWYIFDFSYGDTTITCEGPGYGVNWGATLPDRRKERIEHPEHILHELHESIGLPWKLPQGHRP